MERVRHRIDGLENRGFYRRFARIVRHRIDGLEIPPVNAYKH